MRVQWMAGVFLALSTAVASATDGPDFWQVTGIAEGEELNMRRGPSVQFSISNKLPHNTEQLLNLGCYPEFDQEEWERLEEKERQLAKDMRWCRVMYQGQTGWIFSRYLK